MSIGDRAATASGGGVRDTAFISNLNKIERAPLDKAEQIQRSLRWRSMTIPALASVSGMLAAAKAASTVPSLRSQFPCEVRSVGSRGGVRECCLQKERALSGVTIVMSGPHRRRAQRCAPFSLGRTAGACDGGNGGPAAPDKHRSLLARTERRRTTGEGGFSRAPPESAVYLASSHSQV